MFRRRWGVSLLGWVLGLMIGGSLFAQTLPEGYWPAAAKPVDSRRVLSGATSIDHIRQARKKLREGALREAQTLLATDETVIRMDVRIGPRELALARAMISLFEGDFRTALSSAEQAQSDAVPACPVCGFANSNVRRRSPDDLDLEAALVKALVFAEVKMEGLTQAWAKWVKQEQPRLPLANYLLFALEAKQVKYGHLAVTPEPVPQGHVDFFFDRNSQSTLPVQMIFSQRGKYAGTISLVRYQRAASLPFEYRLAFVDLQGGPLTVREYGRRGPALPILESLAAHRSYSLDPKHPSSLRAELEVEVAYEKGVWPLVSLWMAQTRAELAVQRHQERLAQKLADWEITGMKKVGQIVHPTEGSMKIYWMVGFRNRAIPWSDLEQLSAGETSTELYHFAIFGHEPRAYVASYLVKAIALEPGVWSYALIRKIGDKIEYLEIYDRPPQKELTGDDLVKEAQFQEGPLHDQARQDIERRIDEELADLR
jgi:hypothetical protein